MMPDLPTLERKLKEVRQEVRNLQVMAMRPDQSTEKLELLRNLERSTRAEVKLRLKAVEHHKSQNRAGTYLMTPEQHRARAQLLRKTNPNSRAAYLHDLTARLQQSERK
jgi:hypothetical protein